MAGDEFPVQLVKIKDMGNWPDSVFCVDLPFLALQGPVNALSPRRDPIRSETYGDCSSGVEPRIVIPVVAGSNPVSHPIHSLVKMGCPGDGFSALFHSFS